MTGEAGAGFCPWILDLSDGWGLSTMGAQSVLEFTSSLEVVITKVLVEHL